MIPTNERRHLTKEQWRPADFPGQSFPERVKPSEAGQIPPGDVEDDAFMDTWAVQLDHILGRIGSMTAILDETGDKAIKIMTPAPIDDARNHEKYGFWVTRKVIDKLKMTAFRSRFMPLYEHSELGAQLANDITQAWKTPVEYEVEWEGEE